MPTHLPSCFKTGWSRWDIFLPAKALCLLAPPFVLRERLEVLTKGTTNRQGARSCCCSRLSCELLFITYVCRILSKYPSSSRRCVCGIAIQADNLFIVIWEHCPPRCSMSTRSGYLWKDNTTYTCNCRSVPSLPAKDVTFSWVRTTLRPPRILWGKSPEEQASVPQFQNHLSSECESAGYVLSSPPHSVSALSASNLHLFIWMYFKAVGWITKEYEKNHGPNGPLYVFREDPPVITRNTSVKMGNSEIAVFSLVNK